MESDLHKIKAQYERDDQDRANQLNEIRMMSWLTKPMLLPPINHNKNNELPEKYQNVGDRGLTVMGGKFLTTTFPPDRPWFSQELSGDLRYGNELPDEVKNELEDLLMMRALMGMSILESGHKRQQQARRGIGFRSHKRNTLLQILGTGDALEQMTDDYTLKLFRRDQYVTKRDSCLNVLYHIVKECIDPLNLSDEHLKLAELDATELEKKAVADRLQDIYTRVEWHPRSKTWVIEQEINGHIITTSEEPISPFFSSTYELINGEDYGRGHVEMNMGDLRSLNEMKERQLELYGAISKTLICLDNDSTTSSEDVNRASGEVIRCKVSGGKPQDIGVLGWEHGKDIATLAAGIRDLSQELAKSFMIEQEAQPRQDRVTRLQIERIAQELEDSLGGIYTAIADGQQRPLVERLLWQMERDKIVTPITGDARDVVEIKILTGVEALAKQNNASRVLNFVSTISQLGERAMQRIDTGVLTSVLARMLGVYEPGMIKSDAKLQAEQQAEMQAQLAQQGGQQAIETIGKIAEQQAASQQE